MAETALERMQSKISKLRVELSENEPSSKNSQPSTSISRTISRKTTFSHNASTDTRQFDTKIKQQDEAIQSLQDEIRKRQESYVRREREYRTRIEELETELDQIKSKKRENLDGDLMQNIREFHRQINLRIEQANQHTKSVLHKQQEDMARAFRAQLYEMQLELEKERSKGLSGSSEWEGKAKELNQQLDWTKELANQLTKTNTVVTKENNTLRKQFRTQEDSREHLVRQLVQVKRENERLRAEVLRLQKELVDTHESIEKYETKSISEEDPEFDEKERFFFSFLFLLVCFVFHITIVTLNFFLLH